MLLSSQKLRTLNVDYQLLLQWEKKKISSLWNPGYWLVDPTIVGTLLIFC